MIKFLLKFKWYRMKHLDKFIPQEYKTVYENIQRGIPDRFEDIIAVCNIVEKVKAGVLDEQTIRRKDKKTKRINGEVSKT